MPQSHWEPKRLLLVELAEQGKLHFLLVLIWDSQTHLKSRNHFSSSEETEVCEELTTEVWDFETGKNWTTEPSLRQSTYALAVYFVDANFCNSPDSGNDSTNMTTTHPWWLEWMKKNWNFIAWDEKSDIYSGKFRATSIGPQNFEISVTYPSLNVCL